MNQSFSSFLTALSFTLCTLVLPACAYKANQDDKAILYRIEGYYNLGQFNQSIAEAKKIQPDSHNYKKAQGWLKKAEEARKMKLEQGYQYTRIGGMKNRGNWVIPIQK